MAERAFPAIDVLPGTSYINKKLKKIEEGTATEVYESGEIPWLLEPQHPTCSGWLPAASNFSS